VTTVLLAAFLFGFVCGQALTLAIGAWRARKFVSEIREHLTVLRIKAGATPERRRRSE
jgi:hypothetical protein